MFRRSTPSGLTPEGGPRFADKNMRQEYDAAALFRPAGLRYLVPTMNKTRNAKYMVGQVVRHRVFPFRGVVFDIDPVFNNTEEWYQSIPAEVRPHKDQPFYHLFAENAETEYIAYVSEQNLLPDTSDEPVRHPQVAEVFVRDGKGSYRLRNTTLN
jgi:heat shock protein HspQ